MIIIIIMNMQNKLHAIRFSPHPMTNSQSVPEHQPRKAKLTNSANFKKFPKKTELPVKFEIPDKRGLLTETRQKDSCPPANPHS